MKISARTVREEQRDLELTETFWQTQLYTNLPTLYETRSVHKSSRDAILTQRNPVYNPATDSDVK